MLKGKRLFLLPQSTEFDFNSIQSCERIFRIIIKFYTFFPIRKISIFVFYNSMIHSLHAFRFIFAFMVFLSHLTYIIPEKNKFWSFLYRYIFREGYIGVSFFFMLSGFILTYRYADAIKTNAFSFSIFINRRIARILPMYYVGLLIVLPLTYPELVNGDRVFYLKKLVLLVTLFFAQSFIPISDYYFAFNGVSWSISTELFFYIIFPLLCAGFLRITNVKKAVLYITATVIAMGTIFLFLENSYYWLYINPIMRTADFCIGICLFVFLKNSKLQIPEKNATLWEGVAVFNFVLFFIIQPVIHINFKYAVFYWIPIAMLLAVFYLIRGKISNFLSGKIWVLLGNISFFILSLTPFFY